MKDFTIDRDGEQLHITGTSPRGIEFLRSLNYPEHFWIYPQEAVALLWEFSDNGLSWQSSRIGRAFPSRETSKENTK